jgi:hypothetical protein
MTDKIFPESQLPIRKTSELLPQIFQTPANDKFLGGTLDPLTQPGVLEKTVGYIGRRYGKNFNGSDVYLDSDETLRSRYQLEPGVVVRDGEKISGFYDYIDFKNQIAFFGNFEENDKLTTAQDHYSWNPPIDWDKFINFREYYWVPEGPPTITITGQAQSVTSTYRVKLGTTDSYIFYPDGLTNNPILTLYRGQTYKFTVNAPGEGLTIRTNYDAGSLRFDTELPYTKGSLVLFDNKMWRAKVDIPAGDGSSIDSQSQDWEYVEDAAILKSLDYNTGITNNGTENGTITFVVPFDAPDVLYYQSKTNPNRLGKFIIGDVGSNTRINIENEILGKLTYTSSNGIVFSNGMAVRFSGQVTPLKYNTDDTWIVEGVGTGITLVKFTDLVISADINEEIPEVLFDNAGFDAEPYDDAAFYPGKKDYILINKASQDLNPWSRYNRWFHRSVLEQAHKFVGSDFDSAEEFRAKRPIIEFVADLKLFNHGTRAKLAVDYVDDFTTDVFSKIEGSKGYIVDGESLFEGARVLVIADTDKLANNKIYQVRFIAHNGVRQITLQPAEDSESFFNEGVLVKRGLKNQRLMYHFNGTNWVKSQNKITVNQAPLFDVFDENGVSFSDTDTYSVSDFVGTKIVSYKLGNGPVDTELNSPLSYLNIGNVGDIQFDFNWEKDFFTYQINPDVITKFVKSGFYAIASDLTSYTFSNSWVTTRAEYLQPIIDSVVIREATDTIVFNTVNWLVFDNEADAQIDLYVNGEKYLDSYARNRGRFTFEKQLNQNDTVYIKIFCNTPPDRGYYEIPIGLEKNPLNAAMETFTYGTATDHLLSALEFSNELIGPALGSNNVRDINSYKEYGTRILKHAGVAPLAIALLTDKEINVVKSLQYAKKQYTEFKNSFIDLATKLQYNDDPVELVDDILSELSKAKTISNAFADSDMVGSGAFTPISYIVEDAGINTFTLGEKFDLETLSRRAVYVYLNNTHLIVNRDYQFNSTFGFVKILKELTEGDLIEIKEYVSTASNHIPPTPTKLGLYKKYLPQKFLDDTYIVPRQVIQGHDGSITIAYGDFRDDVLLELEYRIYNNIKKEYNSNLFDVDLVLSGYYDTGIFSREKVNPILNREFLKWISNTNVDYTTNSYFIRENSFTYTYSNMSDPTGTKNLPGYWRGVYQWFYDTDRPHRCPWEMLGFSEQPTWWEEQYGPAPYTSNNLILWEDLRDGIIRQGPREGTNLRYSRPSLLSHIPVDGDGRLLSPLDSSLATNFSFVNNSADFRLGDIAPVEYSWRSSSEFPFAIAIALSLLKPYEYITENINTSITTVNILGQTVNNNSSYFFTISDLVIPRSGTVQATGLIVYVMDYLKSRGLDQTILETKLKNIDVAISTRLSGFVDQTNQRYILDSKNPKSSSGNIFIPPENYDIIFNVSSPISTIVYSGVIIEKTDRGWSVKGYDQQDPFFNYYQVLTSQSDNFIRVGGTAESFVDWAPEKFYGNGTVIRSGTIYYRALRSFTSGLTFTTENLQRLADLPIKGGIEAYRRKNINRLRARQLVYGSNLFSIQEVVDFLFGYEAYLIDQGFKFDGYSSITQAPLNWETAAKEFMFWTKHNWEVGSLLTLSPGAENLTVITPIGIVDNILDSFYDYNIFKNDGTPLDKNFIDVRRSNKEFTIAPINTTRGIYFFKAFLVLKEHVTIFDDRTVFNDVIYDKTTGYRQSKIKSRGFRTTDWDGNYTIPGFIFDNANIDIWQPFVDYKLGDIVSYKSFNWTSLTNQPGVAEFSDVSWTKLDSIPEKKLVPNFDYRINQFEDYYEADADGLSGSQRDLSRHLIGYQPREYLQNLAEDEVIQFKLYQGFIREKGTSNAVVKVFDKTSKVQDDSVVLKEEWAFAVGRFGGLAQRKEVEFNISKEALQVNPQPILVVDSASTEVDQYLRVDPTKFTISESPFTTSINPVKQYTGINRSAGFVKLDQVALAIKDRAALTTVDIFQLNENDHIWIAFDISNSWNVLRYTRSSVLNVVAGQRVEDTVELTFNRVHNFKVGQYVGIKNIPDVNGFSKILSTTATTVVIERALESQLEIDESSVIPVYQLTECKFKTYSNLTPNEVGILKTGAKIWIENNSNNRWEVAEKNPQYAGTSLVNYGISDPKNTGYKTIYVDLLSQVIASMPSTNLVLAYKEGITGLALQHIIAPPSNVANATNHSFGKGLAASTDGKWLIVGAPNASGVRSPYRGDFDVNTDYFIGEIVTYQGKLWKAVEDIPNNPLTNADDGSTIDFNSKDWTPATLIEATSLGRGLGYSNQGCVLIYEWADSQWNFRTTLISPNADIDELFGHSIAIGKNGSNYTMAVSAPGAYENRGRVYLYNYNGTVWSHVENTAYAGVYSSSTEYPAGVIVWYDSKFYQSKVAITGDDSTISLEENVSDWQQVDAISVGNAVPRNIFVDDDGSTIANGLINSDDFAELIKSGDQFGFSVAMNLDASVLVVGAPYSDKQYFANFKGDWKARAEYREGDVVRNNGGYYKLVSPSIDVYDSTDLYVSIGQDPASGDPWIIVGDSSSTATGKIFVYTRSPSGKYKLAQTIAADNLNSLNDTGSSEFISSGDLLGYAIDIDYTGTTIVISSPEADINFSNQGAVYVLESANLVDVEYRVKQKLESLELNPNEFFGASVAISPATEQIVVGAKNSPYKLFTNFDSNSTLFDFGGTTFSTLKGYPGAVYVFERKADQYILGEKLESEFISFESFGFSVDCSASKIVVGSPDYSDENSATPTGKIRLFKKLNSASAWNVIAREEDQIDLDLITTVFAYDNENKVKLAEIEFVDHYKNKIIGAADQEIKYKTLYDPAVYSVGTEEQAVDQSQPWREKHVGEVWWNLDTVKWINYEQGDIAYRTGNWNRLAAGATVDIYEWVESRLLPSEWADLADTTEGLSLGISGQPLYADNTVFSVKEIFNINTGELSETMYYFWVKDKTIIPDTVGRRLSANDVALLIENPAASALPLIAFLGADKFLAYNFDSIITNSESYINIEYRNNADSVLKPIHNEYQLLTEGQADSLPSEYIERKWIDSLVGFDTRGNTVPDIDLAPKQRYGLGFRPRQTMFVDRKKILKIVIDNVNTILFSKPFTDVLDFNTLNSVDPIPSVELNEYDVAVDQYIDLLEIGTARVRPAILTPVIVNGRLESIEIVNTGFGYRNAPPLEIQGDGTGATAEVTLDSQGRIIRVAVLTRGKKYTTALVKIRQFSVLVNSDVTANGFWSIYSYDTQRSVFYRSKSQGFNTTNYWEYADWWKTGYDSTSRIVKEISNFYLEPTVVLSVGDLLRIKEFASGGWAVLERVESGTGNLSGNYNLIARQNGTIQLKDSLYNIKTTPLGYDNVGSYDAALYDLAPTLELRNILKAIKEDIFVDDLRVEWNKLFFVCVNYAFSEQEYVDWAFKTSFLNAVHNIGPFEQRLNYKNDNLDSYQSYLEEVKPYRTTIREYTSRYNNIESTNSAISDFDLPPTYSVSAGKILPITTKSVEIESYPWKWWNDNNGYEITAIEIASGGSDYAFPPTVLIEGNGTGAKAQAYISNGRVTAVKVTDTGKGYTTSPKITLVGGNGFSVNKARAVAILGNGKARTFNMTVKFDRISKEGIYQNLTQDQTFTATGSTAVFDLSYAPTTDKTKIQIAKNGQAVLTNEYNISLYRSGLDTYGLLKGKIIFVTPPAKGDVITVSYEKNNELLDSVNRINKFYAPTSGMKGNSLGQLMTGIDYGGVQIQGTTFDVTGGWDALPWFTEGWDSVESNSDFYYVLNLSDTNDSSKIYKAGDLVKFDSKIYKAIKSTIEPETNTNILPGNDGFEEYWELFEVKLPFTPAVGQLITIYIKRTFISPYLGLSREDRLDREIDNLQYNTEVDLPTRMSRIDDPYYELYDGSTVQPNGRVTAPDYAIMPSFVGNGVTSTLDFINPETNTMYLQLNEGDTLIFRTIESDGSVTIDDVNLVDTNISGGSFVANTTNTKTAPNTIDGAYGTARGILAEEIVVDGDKFITPDQVPATEENVPGQVLDSVSIKVFNTVNSGAAPLQNKVYVGDGVTRVYDIGLIILESKSIIVYVDKIKQNLTGPSVSYSLNLINNTVEFNVAPVENSVIELISIGIGGIEILDYQEFVADGETSLFLTNARFNQTSRVLVTVDGIAIDTGFINSSDIIDNRGLTLIQFGIRPTNNQVIKVISVGASSQTTALELPIIRVNKQVFVFDGSTRSFEIENFVELNRGSTKSSVLVSVNETQLNGVDTIYQIYNGTNNNIVIGVDPAEPIGNITSGNVRVFVNGELKRFVIDYVYDGNQNLITIPAVSLTIGDEIKIESDLKTQFNIVNGQLQIDSLVSLAEDDVIELTWFEEYPSLDVISDEFTGGKINYLLSRIPLNVSYLWVYKNGQRLSQGVDYTVSLPRGAVYLTASSLNTDLIKIVQFGADVRQEPTAYEVYKDMLNVYHFKRFSKDVNVKLVRDLYYYDQSFEVTDASTLFTPVPSRNIPGVVIINNERIEYFVKNGNVLSQLRRGSLGTSIAEVYTAGSFVVDSSSSETVPYSEEQQRSDFVSDGSSLLIGPLDFVPARSNTDFFRVTDVVNGTVVYESIPLAYGRCDDIEVFVGGKRLRKNSMTVYNELLGASSPLADTEVEAEFSVDGVSPYIRLTTASTAGARITVIKRVGKTWYNQGATTASSGVSFTDNTTPMITFIKEKSTRLPE